MRMATAFGALLVNSAYLAASSSPTLFYFANIVLHIALGMALTMGQHATSVTAAQSA